MGLMSSQDSKEAEKGGALYDAAINDDNLNQTIIKSERRAYRVTAAFAQTLLRNEQAISSSGGSTTIRIDAVQEDLSIGASGVNVWDRSWGGGKRVTPSIKANISARIEEGLKKDPYYSAHGSETFVPKK